MYKWIYLLADMLLSRSPYSTSAFCAATLVVRRVRFVSYSDLHSHFTASLLPHGGTTFT